MEKLKIREIELKDIGSIADYWLNSPADYMQGMGVDLDKLPERTGFTEMLKHQLSLPIEERNAYCIIWELNGQAIGHSNTNPTNFGDHAFFHLHIWAPEHRGKGLGMQYLKQTIPAFFHHLHLQNLFCEPYAMNPAPHRCLEQLGFRFEKEYLTTPGSINFEQPVKRWVLSREDLPAHFS